MKKIKIVTVGGGTGSFEILTALRKIKEKGTELEISAIVAMSDSGGSTGVLVDEYGVLPPGDVRQCLVALSSEEKFLRKLFVYRYQNNKSFLGGHSFGNIFISTIEKITGSFQEAIKEAERILNTAGQVLPVTLSKHQLVIETDQGEIIKGEGKISQANFKKIEKIYFDKKTRLNKDAKEAILIADIILINPGSFFTSILPNFLVGGFVKTLKQSKAKKIFITNIIGEKNQGEEATVLDFIKAMDKYVNFSDFDFVLYNQNNKVDNQKVLEKYQAVGGDLIIKDKKLEWKNIKFIGGDFLKKPKSKFKNKNLIRHDGIKIVRKILRIIK